MKQLSSHQCPALAINPQSGEWNFEPFVAWLKEQGVFDEYDTSHPLGPTEKNHQMIDTLNQEKRTHVLTQDQGYHLPRFAGDNVDTSLSQGAIRSVNIKQSASRSALIRLIFASYAGVLEKVFNPEVMKPYLKKYVDDLELEKIRTTLRSYQQISLDGGIKSGVPFNLDSKRRTFTLFDNETDSVKNLFKQDPAILLSVIAYSNALKDFTMSLNSAISTSSCLTESQKDNGKKLCESICVNGLSDPHPLITRIASGVGLACAVRNRDELHERTHPVLSATQEDFQAGMEFVRKQQGFHSYGVRCPAESAIMRLSGIMAETERGAVSREDFGQTLFAMYGKLRTQIIASPIVGKTISESVSKVLNAKNTLALW